MGMIETRTKFGWSLTLDRAEAKLKLKSDDPGQYAPVMVIAPDGQTATGDCALSMGECGYVEIPQEVYNWLEEQIENFWEEVSRT